MTHDRLEQFAPATGKEFKPALGKLWAMTVVFALIVAAGALAAYAWWYEVELPGGRFLTAKAGIAGLVAAFVAIFLVLVGVAFLASAKRLVIADTCVQLLSKGRVVVHIPCQNVGETYTTGDSTAGVVGLTLRDRGDAATLVPFYTKDSYEIQVLVYGKPLEHIHQVLSERLAKFRAGGK
jgi:hypothetical protein